MARKKTKTSNETSGVPAAEERAAAPIAANTDAAVPDAAVPDAAVPDAAVPDTAAAGEAAAGEAAAETNLPLPRAVAPRPTKKSKQAAPAKMSTPKGRTPKLPMGETPTIQEDANKPRKLSALDAAAKVLEEAGQPMNCQEMIGAMAAKGYWTSPAGKTPAGTLYSALLREIKTKSSQTRFQKTARGQFVYQTPKAS